MHDWMPAFLPPELYAAWLDRDTSPDDLQELLQVGPKQVAATLDTYPVSTAVNNARNQGAYLIEPLTRGS